MFLAEVDDVRGAANPRPRAVDDQCAPRDERLGMRKLCAQCRHSARMRPDGPVGGERAGRRHQEGSDESDERLCHWVMVSTDVAPAGSPCPGVHRTRYVPGVGNGRNANVPSVPALAVATVTQPFPSLRSRKSGAPAA